MKVNELLSEISDHIHDPDFARVDLDRLLVFLNSASRDARNEGWYVIKEEDSSIVLVTNTWDYAIPAGFAYLHRLWLQNPSFPLLYDRLIPFYMWEIVDSSIIHGAAIRFDAKTFIIETDRTVKIEGQQRPSTYTLTDVPANDTNIDANMESFLRERTIAYAARFLAHAGNELDPIFDRLSAQAWAISEGLLHAHPQSMRQKPNAQYIPGR